MHVQDSRYSAKEDHGGSLMTRPVSEKWYARYPPIDVPAAVVQ